ncbi:nucleoside triphosphate pyrophosphohydrolase [Streptomyces sp. NPDC096046]|uniref:nucleoside triphosphate pyrophosphohydrolase n=1 Tax=Streptomyces sp. NPDC096046 TaxID=3155542 RepID=UPI00331BE317
MPPEKLVRDKIPQIIRKTGKEPIIRLAGENEYDDLLRTKLVEEVDEFLASENDPEELADIMEVLLCLARRAGVSARQLEQMRQEKADKRGSFDERIVWLGNRQTGSPPSA